MKIEENETEIVGHLGFDGKRIIEDHQCKRIDWLIHHYLRKKANDKSGWNVLYQDPEDHRYWELSYPQGEMQGGGPPSLVWLTESEAIRKYSL